MSFSKIFQILFIVDSTFLFFMVPECLNNSWWCFSSSFSTFEDRRRISPKSWSVLLKIHSSSLCHPLIIIFDCENSFHPSGAIHESFQFDSPKAIISEDLFVLNIQLSFSNSYGGSFKISLPSLSYQFIRCFNPTGGSMKTFPSLRYVYLNPFYENK